MFVRSFRSESSKPFLFRPRYSKSSPSSTMRCSGTLRNPSVRSLASRRICSAVICTEAADLFLTRAALGASRPSSICLRQGPCVSFLYVLCPVPGSQVKCPEKLKFPREKLNFHSTAIHSTAIHSMEHFDCAIHGPVSDTLPRR